MKSVRCLKEKVPDPTRAHESLFLCSSVDSLRNKVCSEASRAHFSIRDQLAVIVLIGPCF